MKSLTKEEAIQAMKEGKKVKHRHFSDDEWVMMNMNNDFVFEDGVRCSPFEFWKTRFDNSWKTGWVVVEPAVDVPLDGKITLDFTPKVQPKFELVGVPLKEEEKQKLKIKKAIEAAYRQGLFDGVGNSKVDAFLIVSQVTAHEIYTNHFKP